MSPTVVSGVEGVKSLPQGESLGFSDWIEIDQDKIDLFAEATGDHQWLHVDPVRAATGPFATTIAHGYLTLSLVPILLPQVLELSGFSMGVNYGCDRVRFPAPVPVGSRVRASVTLDSVTDVTGGVQLSVTMTFEVEGAAKPACIATILVRQYP